MAAQKDEMKETDLAWLAGLIDGDGCIYCRWPRKENIVIEIKMTHKKTIEHVQSLYPGCLTKGSLSKKAFGRKPQWRWTISTRKSKALLEKIVDYLVTKKAHAIAALHYLESSNNKQRALRAAKIRALNA